MQITYDPAKDARNVEERGLPFAQVQDFEWSTALIVEDDRFDYGECRYRAMGYIGDQGIDCMSWCSPLKEHVNVRFDPEVLEKFRASGPGWQTRMNAALADWLKTHTPDELKA